MSNTYELVVHTFCLGNDRENANKIPEEAAESFSAWETLSHSAVLDSISFNPHIERRIAALADELADCITACVNLADRYGIDLQAALERCEQKNRDRGRYDADEVDA